MREGQLVCVCLFAVYRLGCLLEIRGKDWSVGSIKGEWLGEMMFAQGVVTEKDDFCELCSYCKTALCVSRLSHCDCRGKCLRHRNVEIAATCNLFIIYSLWRKSCTFTKWVGGWMNGRGQLIMTHKHPHEEVCQLPAEAKVTRKQTVRVT